MRPYVHLRQLTNLNDSPAARVTGTNDGTAGEKLRRTCLNACNDECDWTAAGNVVLDSDPLAHSTKT